MPKTERSAAARVAGTGAPAPTRVPCNDWRQVDLPAAETFEPSQPVSVIVPYFEAPAALDLTLAALETQTYPRDLFEVIVVDDGSRPSLAPRSTSSLDPRFVRQPRRGFGLARARNTGARAAAHDILVFLDGDVLAEADMLKEHARWHHAVSDAVTVGFCNYVSTRGVDADRIRKRSGSLRALFADRPFDPSWTDEFLGVSDQMTATEHGIFRVVTGGNFGIGKAFYRSLGGFDETFVRYGSEDTEFGYRAFAHGGLLVPMPSHAWHQGRWSDNRSPAKERDLSIMRAKLVNHIPHPDFRPLAAGRIYAVPETVVTVTAGKLDARGALRTVETILADPERDLVARVETPDADADELAWLVERLRPDPRVTVAASGTALDEYPTAPFHIRIPAGAIFERGLVRVLRTRIGNAVVASAVLADGCTVSIVRGWALHRARRTGKTAADFGTAITLRLRPSMFRDAVDGEHRGGPGIGRAGVVGRLLGEVRRVRTFRSGWRLLMRLARALLRRLAPRPRDVDH